MATRPYLGVHHADRALVLSHEHQLIVLAAHVIGLADQARSFVLSHDRPASSFQQVLKGDRSIDSLGRAIHHRETGDTFRGHQLGCTPAGAISVDEELRRHGTRTRADRWRHWRHQVPDDDDFKWVDAVLSREVVSAAAQLFGEDRTRHEKCGQKKR
jgi:hypothetical protein